MVESRDSVAQRVAVLPTILLEDAMEAISDDEDLPDLPPDGAVGDVLVSGECCSLDN